MKTIYRFITLPLCLIFAVVAYPQQRTVKFTGRDRTNQYRIKLDRVEIFNLDQLWEEVIYWPDTTLTMGVVGVEDYGTQVNVQLMRNTPNPFNGKTTFALVLPEERDLRLEVLDMNGKCVIGENYSNLVAGTHLFEAVLVSPQTYLLSATVRDGRMTLKMVNEGNGGANAIRYLGMSDLNGDLTLYLKNDCAAGNFPFAVGDEMQYTGYATIDGMEWTSSTVTKQQTNNETIPLLFDVTGPSVGTTAVSEIMDISAICGGVVTSDGGTSVIARGVCWSTFQNPTINDAHTVDGSGLGDFTSNLAGLVSGTHYFVRAYATNSVGTAYGEQLSFTTKTKPTVTTYPVSSITNITATCGGNVLSSGGAPVTARGVCWSTSQNPTINTNHTVDGSGAGTFTSNLTGLAPGNTYYVRAYATNSVGTAYGEERSFMTDSCPTIVVRPTNTTGLQQPLCPNYGHLNVMAVDAVTGAPIPNLTYSWSGEGVNYTSTNNQSFIAINENICSRLYNIVVQATDTVAGCEISDSYLVSVIDTLPPVFNGTLPNGYVYPSANGNYYIPDYTAYLTNQTVSDNCYPFSQLTIAQNPAAGTEFSGTTVVTITLSDRCGNVSVFSETIIQFTGDSYPCYGTPTVTDYDGNVYNTVQIGNQCWMKQNLKTTHYSDGTSIALGNSASETTAYRYYPKHISSNVSTYGYLYNWKAVMRNSSSSSTNPSGVQGICPTGWHVPSYAEWTQLTDYVSIQSAYLCGNNNTYIAKALASTTGWNLSSNFCAVGNAPDDNNATEFAALPAGYFYQDTGSGQYCYAPLGNNAEFWTTTNATSGNHSYFFGLTNVSQDAMLNNWSSWIGSGLSVRCLKD